MLKTIPKSNVSKRSFQVNKSWIVTSNEYPVISGSYSDATSSFDSNTANKQEGLYTDQLFKSIKSKYYSDIGNPFTLHGTMENIGDSFERVIGTNGYVIALPQSKYGEGVQPESITISDLTNSDSFSDDGFGNITSNFPLYTLISLDLQTGDITLADGDDGEFYGTLYSIPGSTAIDFQTGEAIMTFNNDTDSFFIVKIDLQQGTLQTQQQLSFQGFDIDQIRFGNVFYSEGIVVLNDNALPFSSYTMNFKSTKTINELEVLVTSKAGEFNYSQNPSAVDVTVSGSYEFETTPVFNSFPSRKKKITVIDDIKRQEFYSGSVNHSISGSWNDYDASGSIDPTGSYLATYVSTIGIYDNTGEMIAVAKLPQPIKNLPDYDLNFIVRLDT